MTDIEIFENEISCIKRRASGRCNGGVDCCKCDLLMDEKEIISAYERAILANKIIDKQKAEITRLQNLSRKRGAMIGGISRRKGRNY